MEGWAASYVVYNKIQFMIVFAAVLVYINQKSQQAAVPGGQIFSIESNPPDAAD